MKDSLKTLKQIYKDPKAVTLQAIVFLLCLFLISYSQNSGQVHTTLGYDISFVDKINLIKKILLFFYTDNVSKISLFLYIAVALLFSYVIVLVAYYFKKRRTLTGIKNLSLSGILTIFGVGCAACGGLLLSTILNIVGAASLLTFLPYGGSEFLVLAIALLTYSVVSISKKINAPLVC